MQVVLRSNVSVECLKPSMFQTNWPVAYLAIQADAFIQSNLQHFLHVIEEVSCSRIPRGKLWALWFKYTNNLYTILLQNTIKMI